MEIKLAEAYKDEMVSEIFEGLMKNPKELPCKLFYDEKGSALFEEICLVDEYYPTRTEIEIMENHICEITSELGEEILLAELGSGSSIKTRLLLENLNNLTCYVPIDISSEFLFEVANGLKEKYPHINIHPLTADYTKEFELPQQQDNFKKTVYYFPGSTIGNFTPAKAKIFLRRLASMLKENDGLLIGVDLKKDKSVLEEAYNDSAGITAEFNLNILNHINNTQNSNFDLNKFKHHAFFNEKESRIEMHLISSEDHEVIVAGMPVKFKRDEHIITEYSYKYTPESFNELVSERFRVRKVWTDGSGYFSVQYLSVK